MLTECVALSDQLLHCQFIFT